jgi:hypothetical protein
MMPGLIIDSSGIVTYSPTRYIVFIDGVMIEQDLSIDRNTNMSYDKKWFTFPFKNPITLNHGEHTVRITMGGAFYSKFYRVGFELDRRFQ